MAVDNYVNKCPSNNALFKGLIKIYWLSYKRLDFM